MPIPGNQFFSSEFGDIEEYFVNDYDIIDNYVGDRLFLVGKNAYANLGTNSTQNKSTPVTTFAGGTNWKQVDMGAGEDSVVSVKTDGTLWTWGINSYGQLGTNNTLPKSTPVTTFAGGNNWKYAYGSNTKVALKTDGSLWVWGANYHGTLGINRPTGTGNHRTTPVTTFAGGTNWKQVSVKADHVTAIKNDGSLWVWGWNAYGQLGVNDTTSRITPVTTFAGGNNWKYVSAGGNFTAAIKNDGTLWTWGRNAYGALGINNTVQRLTPVTTFAGGINWKTCATGNFHTAALKTDGSLWAWGDNLRGGAGNNTGLDKSTPVTTFAGGNDWAKLYCGVSYTAAIKTNGSLWVWGANVNANLGINNNADKSTPVTTFLGGNNWKTVGGGFLVLTAITSGLNVDLS